MKHLQDFILEMAHAHKEKKTRFVMTPWGEYTGEEEEILIENTETRDQPKNKENAMRQLRSILYDKELQHRMEEQAKVEAGKKKIEWGSQIRSYVFDDRRVKDHRTGFQTSDVDAVMDGKLDGFIKAYLMEFAASEAAEEE